MTARAATTARDAPGGAGRDERARRDEREESPMSDGRPMICPKCGGEMRIHRRNGVTIEQCRKCHGIFLDRGEFEQLLGREMSILGRVGGGVGEGEGRG